MHAFRLDTDDPARRLAADEAMLRGAERGLWGECFHLYELPAPAVVLGVSGRWREDAFADRCRREAVPILRRPSGGGAVVLGPGCLCYSLVLDTAARPGLRSVRASYRWILGRLAGSLEARGAPCRHAGLSDLAAGTRKVGGSAQKRARRMILHHGTLLYAFAPALMTRLLPEPAERPPYRAGRAHEQFVGHLPLGPDALRAAVADAFGPSEESDPPGAFIHELDALLDSRYSRPEWHFRR
jgi:lipoate-protein ligase A